MTKILVIDHDTLVRNEVVDWLGIEGFEVLSAEDGLGGVQSAYHHVPNLIVCDLTVPQLDGYGVLLELRANPLTAETPIIFLTSKDSEQVSHPKFRIGADDYISKPFTQQNFLNTIKVGLEKRATRERELQQQVLELEQALVEEHEQRLLKAKLTAMVAHDFRNPLTVILSSNGLLRDYSDRMDESRRNMHRTRIDASVLRLLTMLDEMLVLAQIDAGSLTLIPEPLNLGSFLEGIVDEFQSIYSDSHSIAFESSFADVMLADPRLLRQIVANLLSNAIKYSPPGSTVYVVVEKNHEQIILRVRDEGIGIAPEDQVLLFHAFHRGANVGSTPGTGLGLTIVKQAVDLHLGDIQVESEPGSGTTMIVTLPMNPM